MPFIDTVLTPFILGLFSNYASEEIQKINNKMKSSDESIKKLFVTSFLECIKFDDKHTIVPSYKKDLKKLKKEIENNDAKFFELVDIISNNDNFLNAISKETNRIDFINQLFSSYNIDIVKASDDIFINLHEKLLRNFKINFIKNMSTNPSDKIILHEVLKLDNVVELLNKIDVQVNEFDEIKSILLSQYIDTDKKFKKNRDYYDNYIINKFRYLELAGFSPKISGKDIYMNLMDVFIPLKINIKEEKSIFFHHTTRHISYEKKVSEMINDVLSNDGLVILGDPGSGKSTLLKFISAYIAINRKKLGFYEHIVPIFIRVADYAEYFKKERKGIYDFFISDTQFSHLFKENFEYSNLLFLLDGLDEITDASIRNRVVENIIDLKSRYPKNKYIVTSRIIGYKESSLGGHFVESKLLDFTELDIQQFAKQWYSSIAQSEIKDHENLTSKEKEEIKARYQTLANELYKSISRNSSVIKFATNPLLMTIVAMIYFRSKKLPNKRVELYDIATETFLDNWVKVRFEENTKIKEKGSVLELLPHIAFEMHTDSSEGLISEEKFRKEFTDLYVDIYDSNRKEALNEFNEFKDFLEKYAGFFYRKDMDGNNYGFVHLTFEEYLCALEFSSRWDMNELKIQDYIYLSRWIEVIRLSVANLKISHKGKSGRAKATKFIQEILDADRDYFPDAYRPFQLAILILVDDVEIESKLKNELISIFLKVLENTIYEILLNSFSKLFGELLESIYKEDFLLQIKEKLKTGSRTLQANILKILMPYSDCKEVEVILLELLDNDIIFNNIFTYKIDLLSFQNNLTSKPKFKKLLRKYIIDNYTEIDLHQLFTIYLNSIGIFETYNIFGDTKKIDDYIDLLNSEDDAKFKYLFSQYVLLHTRNGYRRHNFTDEQILKINDKELRNKIHVLNDMTPLKFKDVNRSMSTLLNFKYIVSLDNMGHSNLIDTAKLQLIEFSYDDDLKSIIENLPATIYSPEEFLEIKEIIIALLGPEKCEDATSFYLSYSNTKFLHHFGWLMFAINNLHNNKDILNQYIKAGSLNEFFLIDFEIKDNLKKIVKTKYFEKFPPNLKVSFLKLLNQDIDFSLIRTCIDYYSHLEDSNEKSETYKLLYTYLNPLNIIDDWII